MRLDTGRFVFHPYVEGRKVTEQELQRDFAGTWEYLCRNRAKLESRRSNTEGGRAWWEPVRPRKPGDMFRPKIVTPHLVVVPRFALDADGRYAVSHSPFLYPKDQFGDPDLLLRFFVAVLNSTVCYWHVARHSHHYQHGYAMLEVGTLSGTPVPDPARVPPALMRRLLGLVNDRLGCEGSRAADLELQLDRTVADIYGLTQDERRILGMER